MNTPEIRRARRNDVAALLVLEALFPSDALKRRNLRYLLQRETAGVWVAEIGGRVVGSIVLLYRSGSGTARLYSIVVEPAQRGQGVGRLLVDFAEQQARARGCGILSLEVRSDNHQARALYLRAGFEIAKRISKYYVDGADALRMQKQISMPAHRSRSGESANKAA